MTPTRAARPTSSARSSATASSSPAERAPRDWSGYANVITVAAGEDGPVVTAGLQKRVTFRPKGEDETVAAAELIAKAFCPPEAPMPTDALRARIDAFLGRTTRSRSRPAAENG